MSRQDPGAATGTGRYPAAQDCACGHSEGVHAHRPGRARGACSASGCGCREHVPSGLLPTSCPHCGAPWSPQEARRVQ